MSQSVREGDGIKRLYRGLWEQKESATKFDFAGLPAGDYRLRFLARGFETVDLEIALRAGEALDLGRIDLIRAKGRIHVVIADQKGAPDDLEFGYVVRLYETGGHSLSQRVGPGGEGSVWFLDLPAGSWQYRVERMLEGDSHTRYVGWDPSIPLEAGEEKRIEVDCTWRFDDLLGK